MVYLKQKSDLKKNKPHAKISLSGLCTDILRSMINYVSKFLNSDIYYYTYSIFLTNKSN